ncbi:MAG: aminotransferase class III-fold pyridoxal phosphate-dependent enzyme, partial [Planctomycetota bacterium]|nr:aminotransferase class III-fold pyridoxal phosphate-dependent enzyme [Planctomycetota bacterium]
HASELACVLLDPKAGILEPVEGLAEAVSATAGAHDVLVIVDEVVAFRLARGGWQQLNEITPDLTTYGKLIGGGFPIGAFGGRAELMDRLDMREGATGFHQSGTFSAHPVAMAAGLATLKEMTAEAFQTLDQLGSCLADGLSQVAGRHELPLSWVVSGSLFSLYFADDPPRGYRDLAGCRREWNSLLFHQLIERGYYLSHSLAMNAFSLAMGPGDVQGLVTAIDESLEALVPSTT